VHKCNSELLVELERRTQWEAVRLSTLLRERSAEENARSKYAILKALEAQKESFDNTFKKHRQHVEQEAEVEIAKRQVAIKTAMQEQLDQMLEQQRAEYQANEEELVEGMQTNFSKHAAADAEARADEISQLANQVRALEMAFEEDANYKKLSFQVSGIPGCIVNLQPDGSQCAIHTGGCHTA